MCDLSYNCFSSKLPPAPLPMSLTVRTTHAEKLYLLKVVFIFSNYQK